ncbi:MAG: DEAD/DEAH box helicase [Methylococcales bacterium]
MSELLLKPGLRLGYYPQKPDSSLSAFEQRAVLLASKLGNRLVGARFTAEHILKTIETAGKPLENCSELALNQAISELRTQLQRHGCTDVLLAQAFAVIRETAHRSLTKRHFDNQLLAGWVMMKGMLVEMDTGEGKTLATALPACTAALAGIPVHVITANDYLAARDAENLAPLYQRLGLSSGAVVDGMETQLRRNVYQCAIVHTTNKQIAFDYLRDRLAMANDMGILRCQFRHIQQRLRPVDSNALLLRGLCFALIDEADSVLIDEAKTPLIISQVQSGGIDRQTYVDALHLAALLTINKDFIIDFKSRDLQLTRQGEQTLAGLVLNRSEAWQNKRNREALLKQALIAEFFYKKDKHYVVNEGKVQIVDEFTGRIMADRCWQQGLQQMIEAKENCAISEQRNALARISYQRFFSRYLRLAGTSGTLKEVAAEMHSIYGLQTVSIAPRRPSQRSIFPERVYRSAAQQQQVFLNRITELYAQNRPVLIGTNSVAESEQVAEWLTQVGLPHRVLNAKQDQHEAQIIAQAGVQQAITVATNMAGRGTDIVLGPGVAELGGLHVLNLSLNDAGRIDRQLYGRCARQGDPGSAEAILVLPDAAAVNFYCSAILKIAIMFQSDPKPIPKLLSKLIVHLLRQSNERQQRLLRKQVMKQDQYAANALAFSGKFE